MILAATQGHDDPANRAQEACDRRRRASIALAPWSLIGSGALRPFQYSTIEEDPNGLVPRERSLEMLVKMRAIACDDDKLPKLPRLRGLLEKTRKRCPRRAPTGRALLVTDAEALVTIETQDEMSQREMHARRERSLGGDCHGFTSFAWGLSRPESRSRLTSS
jgi:hypothetical protein